MDAYKDEVLVALAASCNVAQFVSYGPDKIQRHNCICGHKIDELIAMPAIEIASLLLSKSIDHKLNIRSFRPAQWSGNPFITGLDDVDEICDHINDLTDKGYHVIVHEAIDVCDGGISCVLNNGYVEFVPDDTPRFVEKVSDLPIPSLTVKDFISFLSPVYTGVKTFQKLCVFGMVNNNHILFDCNKDRVEFNLHPRPCGYKHYNITIWEIDRSVSNDRSDCEILTPRRSCFDWPNKFSQHIGDKVYGLLVANMLTDYVPRTIVHVRTKKVAPFMFGADTGTEELWTRTCPKVQVPGKYATVHKYADPYQLMNDEDPDNEVLTSCIVQTGVKAEWSGAYICDGYGKIAIEGTRSYGDEYMQGAKKEELPHDVYSAVLDRGIRLAQKLHTNVRFEWVYDGYHVWVVQLHMGSVESDIGRKIIYLNSAPRYIEYHPEDGLDSLRELIETIKQESVSPWSERSGICVVGNVGMSSHIADILRKERISSYIKSK